MMKSRVEPFHLVMFVDVTLTFTLLSVHVRQSDASIQILSVFCTNFILGGKTTKNRLVKGFALLSLFGG